MYEAFYQLSVDPFRLSPDHRFCFEHPSFKKAKAYMQYALHRAEGFMMITGAPGCGKTTLINSLLATLEQSQCVVARLATTQLRGEDFLRAVGYAFKLPVEGLDQATVLRDIERFLVQHAESGRKVLLVVDEAQDLQPSALTELRLLANMQHGADLLLQAFLVGQESLNTMLRDPQMQQFRQRVIAACHLESLTAEQTREYVLHRLRCAGWRNNPNLEDDIHATVHRFSRGVPRQINFIASRLLLHGWAEGKNTLTGEDAATVAGELKNERLADADTDAPGRAPLPSALVAPRDEVEDGTQEEWLAETEVIPVLERVIENAGPDRPPRMSDDELVSHGPPVLTCAVDSAAPPAPAPVEQGEGEHRGAAAALPDPAAGEPAEMAHEPPAVPPLDQSADALYEVNLERRSLRSAPAEQPRAVPPTRFAAPRRQGRPVARLALWLVGLSVGTVLFSVAHLEGADVIELSARQAKPVPTIIDRDLAAAKPAAAMQPAPATTLALGLAATTSGSRAGAAPSDRPSALEPVGEALSLSAETVAQALTDPLSDTASPLDENVDADAVGVHLSLKTTETPLPAPLQGSVSMVSLHAELEELMAGLVEHIERMDGETLKLSVGKHLSFAPGTSAVAPSPHPTLARLATFVERYPRIGLRIVAHTSSRPGREIDTRVAERLNVALSEARAQAVAGYLTEQGVPAARISAEGRGGSEPLADNTTAEGRRLNRRIEVFLERDAASTQLNDAQTLLMGRSM